MSTNRQPEAGKTFLLSNDTLSKVLGLIGKRKPTQKRSLNTDSNIVSLINRSGASVQSFNTLEITQSGVPSSQSDYSSDSFFEGNNPPVDSTKLAVLQEPLNDDDMGRAVISGVTTVRVDVTDISHGFASPQGTPVLTSSASGPLQLLDPATSTGEQLLKCTFTSATKVGQGMVHGTLQSDITNTTTQVDVSVTFSLLEDVSVGDIVTALNR